MSDFALKLQYAPEQLDEYFLYNTHKPFHGFR